MTENDKPVSGLSRRTVVKAAAWSVPIIAVGSSAPAMAVTGVFQLTGAACKLPGNSQSIFKGYAFGVTAVNPFDCEITLTFTSATLDGQDLGDIGIVETSPICQTFAVNTLVLGANTTLTDLIVLTQNAPDSSNGALSVTYTIAGTCIPDGQQTATQSVDATPPIQGNSCDDFTAAEKACVQSIIGVPEPTITTLSDPELPQGAALTISGTNFDDSAAGATVVQFGAVTAVIDSITPTEIQTTVPLAAPDGGVILAVSTFGGTATAPFNVL